MITILQSANLPELAKRFAEQVRNRQDPFRAPLVLVPNVMLRTWLSYHVSEQGARADERVAINLDFRYLDEGLWDILAALDPAANPGAGPLSLPPAPGGEGKAPVRRLKREYRQWMIIQELHQALKSDLQGVLSPLLGYLSFDQGGPEDRAAGQSKRLWQLADGLARLFLEYETNRPDVILEWARGEQKRNGPAHPMFEAQRSLYTTLFGLDGLCARTNPRYLSLPQYFWTLFQEPSKLHAPQKWHEVHVFTLPQVSRLHVEIFGEVGKLVSLYIHDLAAAGDHSGLMAQWGKVERSKLSLLTQVLSAGVRNTVLSAGVLSTERPAPNERAIPSTQYSVPSTPLSAGASSTEDPCTGGNSVLSTQYSVLSCLQAHLQGRSPARRGGRQDASIQIGACPSIRREVETVYSNIVQHMLAANKPLPPPPPAAGKGRACLRQGEGEGQLALTDFAILVPDMSLYRPVIESVFGRVADSNAALDPDSRDAAYERPLLTFNLLDANAAEISVYAQALEALLALGDEGYTRKELFHLVQNPCFLARHGLERADVKVWLDWAAALNIYRDAESEQPPKVLSAGVLSTERPTPNERAILSTQYSVLSTQSGQCHSPDETGEVFAWRHGMRRLRLGRIMLPPRDSLNEQDAFRDLVPYADMESQSAEQVGKFCTLISELIQSARELRGSSHTCGEWQVLLQRQLERFLEIPSDRREEQVVSTALFRALQDLRELDSHIHAPTPPPPLSPRGSGKGAGDRVELAQARPEGRGERFGFALVREMVSGSLISMPAHRGHLLLDGVTVAALRPGRIVPFRYVYVLGLGAGNFPGEEAHSALDLRQNALRTRDDLAAIDAGREAMREVFLSAGERVYLTYVARDLQKDEEFQPCAIVNELCAYLENEVFSPGSFTPFQRVDIPLKGSSCKYLAADPSSCPAMKGQKETDLLCRPCFRHDRFLASQPEAMRRKLSARFAASSSLLPPSPSRGGEDPGELAQPGGGGGNAVRRITLRELADFLTDPVKAVLKHRLRLKEEEEDDRALAEAEPTTTGFPLDYNLYAAAQQHCLDLLVQQSQAAPPDVPEQVREETLVFLERYYAREARRGATPASPFKLLDERRYTEELTGLLESKDLQALLGQRGRALHVAFGTQGWRGDSRPHIRSVVLPPLTLAGQNSEQVEVHSNRLLVLDHQDGLCWIATVAGSASMPAKGMPSKHVLEPMLLYLALRASKEKLPDAPGLAGEAGSKIVVLYKDGIRIWPVPVWQPSDAYEYLWSLACECLYANRIEFLPFDEVIGWPELRDTLPPSPSPPREGVGGGEPSEAESASALQRRLAGSLRIKVEDSLAAEYPRTSDLDKLIPVVVPADPLAVARRRLKPVLGGLAMLAEVKARQKTAKEKGAAG